MQPIIIGLINMLGSDPMREILLDVDEAKGNAFQLFTVQNAMWVALMFGFGELILRYLSAADEEGQLERGLSRPWQPLCLPMDLPSRYPT